MKIKKRVCMLGVLVMLTAAPGNVMAQNAIDQLAGDLRFFFQEFGKEIVPNLQTASVMNHELGSAQLGDFPRMYFSLSTGATVDLNGGLKFTKEEFSENYNNFGLFRNLFDEIGLNDEGTRDITDNYFPLPSMRAGVGVGLAQGWELSVQLGIIPEAATAFALGFIDSNDNDDGFDASGIRGGITTVGTRVRKVLVEGDRGIPAISAGVGYVFSNVDLRVPLDGISVSTGGDGNDLNLQGSLDFLVKTHSFGVDIRTSRQFLRIFYPFLGLSSYYQFTDYTAGVTNFGGTIGGSELQRSVEPASRQNFQSFNNVLHTGFDMKLGVLNLFLHGNYALETRAPGAIAGMRLQF